MSTEVLPASAPLPYVRPVDGSTSGQLELSGADFSKGWDVFQAVQNAKTAGSYSLVRVEHRQGYEQARRWLLEGLSVNEVARLTGWAWRTVSAIRQVELSQMSELKQRLAREELETAQLCNERIREALEANIIEPRDLGIIKGISLQRAVELMGSGGEFAGPKAERGLRAEDLKAFLDKHLQALPSCAPIDSASVTNASFDSGLAAGRGQPGCAPGGLEGAGPGSDGSVAWPGLAGEQGEDRTKGGAGGGASAPASPMADGFIPQKF